MRVDRPASGLWAGLGLVAVVRGRSLEPVLYDGDVVLAIRRWRPPAAGEFVLAWARGRIVVKQVCEWHEDTHQVELQFPARQTERVGLASVLARVVLMWSWSRRWFVRPGGNHVPEPDACWIE